MYIGCGEADCKSEECTFAVGAQIVNYINVQWFVHYSRLPSAPKTKQTGSTAPL